jgi:two-component system response regulator YesN
MWKAILVDDEPGVTDGLSIMIDWSVYGFQIVGTADDGPEALRLIQMEDPDLVVTDIKMPEMDGIELVRRAQRLPNHRPRFLILSGHKDFEYARAAMTLGVEDYLIKPIYEEDLGQALATLAEKLGHESTTKNEETIGLIDVLNGRAEPSELMRSAMEQPFVVIVGSIDDYALWRDKDKSATAESESRLARFMSRILKLGKSRGFVASEEGRTVALLPDSLIRGQHGSMERYLEKLQSYVTVGNQPSASFLYSHPLQSLSEALELWQSVPRAAELLRIYAPRARMTVYELLRTDANPNPQLVTPDQDIIHHVADGDRTGAEQTVGECEETAVAGRAEPSLVVNYINKICFELHRLITELGGNPATVDELQRLCKSSLGGLTMRTQFTLLREASGASADYVQSLSQVRPSARMQQICRDLVRTFREDITIRELAQRHGISPAYLGQLFKKEYGESFNDYRNRLRIEEAARLLRTTEMRIYEISQHVGYQSTDYFERRFSAFYNTTPTAYRTAAQNGSVPAHTSRR